MISLESDYINKVFRSVIYLSASSVIEEFEAVPKMAKEAKQINSFGNIPLVVITGENKNRTNPKDFEYFMSLQESLLKLSTQSKHVFASQSGHDIPFEEPEVVIDVIRKLIKKK